jgi:hypothetical protein
VPGTGPHFVAAAPDNRIVAIEREGRLALATPPLMEESISAISWLLSVTHAFARVRSAPPPFSFTLTFAALLPELMNCTAMEPSRFLNAAVFTPEGAPKVPTRIAPGRTNRL